MKTYREEPWLSPKVEIRTSNVHGKGIHAARAISKGEIIATWGGNFVGKEESEKARGEVGKKIQQIDDEVFEIFDFEMRGDDQTYFHNHSFGPNTWK